MATASRQDVQNKFETVKDKWILSELVIAEVSSKIISRLEYCKLNKISYENKLWVNDPYVNNCWRWNRVFEFKIIKIIKKDILLSTLNSNITTGFLNAVKETFCYGKSRELSLSEYRNTIEVLL